MGVCLIQGLSRPHHLRITPPTNLQADKFHKTGRQLRSRMWWQSFRMKMIIIVIIILVAVIIFCAVCFSGGNCLKKG